MVLIALSPVRLFLQVLVLASVVAAQEQPLEPSRLSCDAKYATPCARINVEWLAVNTVEDILAGLASNATATLQDAWDAITRGEHNMEQNFYPFVFDKQTGICAAHGAVPGMVGLTLQSMFELVGNSFSDPDAVLERMYAASNKGGGWVQYIWSDGSDGHYKFSYVTNVTDRFLLGVGYESSQLPRDVPCSAKYDSWCSITNVISLLGSAQSLLVQAESLPQFETAAYELSFNPDYQVEVGFYVFMYSFEGVLTSHAMIHDFLGKTFEDVIEAKGLGTKEDALALHSQFIDAANGHYGGWARYEWVNADDEVFTKVALVVKIDFQGKSYYLGCGFDFNSQVVGNHTMSTNVVPTSAPTPAPASTMSYTEMAAYSGPPSASSGSMVAASQSVFVPITDPCSQQYNLPCSFQTALQLTSHALSHAVSSRTSEAETWRAIAEDAMFHSNDFYVFVVR
jgi:hypothetical protein